MPSVLDCVNDFEFLGIMVRVGGLFILDGRSIRNPSWKFCHAIVMKISIFEHALELAKENSRVFWRFDVISDWRCC
jgi:hypothetical protein